MKNANNEKTIFYKTSVYTNLDLKYVESRQTWQFQERVIQYWKVRVKQYVYIGVNDVTW